MGTSKGRQRESHEDPHRLEQVSIPTDPGSEHETWSQQYLGNHQGHVVLAIIVALTLLALIVLLF